jgi:hypothetical protein
MERARVFGGRAAQYDFKPAPLLLRVIGHAMTA